MKKRCFSSLASVAVLCDVGAVVGYGDGTLKPDGTTEESVSDVTVPIENDYAPMVLVGEQWKIVTVESPVEVDDADLDTGEYASIK